MSEAGVAYDTSRPALPQVYAMGDRYEAWVETPLKHLRPTESLVIFGGPLEALTHIALWQPLCWLFARFSD